MYIAVLPLNYVPKSVGFLRTLLRYLAYRHYVTLPLFTENERETNELTEALPSGILTAHRLAVKAETFDLNS